MRSDRITDIGRQRRSWSILLPLALAVLAGTTALAQHPFVAPIDPLSSDPQPFDVLAYDLTLDLSEAPQPETIGVCAITLVWTDTVAPQFRFNLRDLVIDSIRYEHNRTGEITMRVQTTIGDPADADYHHVVAPSGPVHIGDTATFTVFYQGEMTDEEGPGTWGGVSSSNNVLYAMGVGFNNNYVSTTQHWMPCYDHPSDKAVFAATFTIPAGSAVASNGLLVDTVTGDDGTARWRWVQSEPAATYLLTFAVADYIAIEPNEGDVPMVIYTLPQDSLQTGRTFALLPEMVDWFAEKFGDYPFAKVGYVNTPQGAMEHQTMISFPTFLSRRGDSLNLTGAHELAHQWFGNLVSPLDFRHAWLNESFATFCEALWVEREAGFTGYLANINGSLNNYVNTIAPSEGTLPLFDFDRESPSSNYPATIYQKGAVIVGMLRFELGDSLFFAAMQRFLADHAYGNATTEDMQRTCEEIAGRDLDLFFDQWIRRPGWPIFEVYREATSNDRTAITFRQVQSPDDGLFRNVPVEVRLTTRNGPIIELFRIDSLKQTFVVDVDNSDVFGISFNQGPSLRTLAQFDVGVAPGVFESGRRSDAFTTRFDAATGLLRIDRDNVIDVDYPIQVRLIDADGRTIVRDSAERLPVELDVGSIPSGYYGLEIGRVTSGLLIVR